MENKTQISWFWIIPIALILPSYYLLIIFMQFGQIGPALLESLIFAPAGMIEGAFFIYWLREVKSDRQRRNILIGFIGGFILAFFGSLLLPLMLPMWLGATIGGAVPWVLCTWLGYNRPVPEPRI
jgi:hypothetical protein